ncbi:hypothetical protein ACL2XP_08500 [Sodalis sp. RH21]|uniref:hypothetical protein n=1 Tax=unclassified Sodalis (in: enterobacteria) TaxID=2636512 RepID=UPI0039B4D504
MISSNDHSGISMQTGTSQEVCNWLGRSHADHVLVIAFDHVESRHFDVLVETLTSAIAMFDVLIQ